MQAIPGHLRSLLDTRSSRGHSRSRRRDRSPVQDLNLRGQVQRGRGAGQALPSLDPAAVKAGMLDAEDGNRTDDAARRDTRTGLGDHVLPTADLRGCAIHRRDILVRGP